MIQFFININPITRLRIYPCWNTLHILRRAAILHHHASPWHLASVFIISSWAVHHIHSAVHRAEASAGRITHGRIPEVVHTRSRHQTTVLICSVTRHLVRSTDCGTHARTRELRLGGHIPSGTGHALFGIGATIVKVVSHVAEMLVGQALGIAGHALALLPIETHHCF